MENQTKDKMLSKTSGIWKDRKIDGLEYVRKLRDEWNRKNYSRRNIQPDDKQKQ